MVASFVGSEANLVFLAIRCCPAGRAGHRQAALTIALARLEHAFFIARDAVAGLVAVGNVEREEGS